MASATLRLESDIGRNLTDGECPVSDNDGVETICYKLSIARTLPGRERLKDALRFRPSSRAMMEPVKRDGANILLGALAESDFALLKPHLTRVKLEHEMVLVTADQPIEHVYFLEDGIASIVSTSVDEGTTEVGIFGREGLSGMAALLGSDTSPHDTFMQVDGTTALRVESDRLLALTRESPSLQAMFLRYVQVFLVQIASSTVSNARHRMEARLARWLLMCHDRIEGDEVVLTHEFMSMMIAAQRTGVTVTLHILEGAGMIRAKRGRVTIVDREKLEILAGESYGKPEAVYRRLIGPFGRPGSEVAAPA